MVVEGFDTGSTQSEEQASSQEQPTYSAPGPQESAAAGSPAVAARPSQAVDKQALIRQLESAGVDLGELVAAKQDEVKSEQETNREKYPSCDVCGRKDSLHVVGPDFVDPTKVDQEFQYLCFNCGHRQEYADSTEEKAVV